MQNEVNYQRTGAKRLAHLARLLNELWTRQPKNAIRILNVLEIGSYRGNGSTPVLAVREQTRAFCIDPWESLEDFQTFQANTTHLPVIPIRGRSLHVLPILAKRKFDLIYIDGDHTMPTVAFDMSQATRLVADGGVICGDDLECQVHQMLPGVKDDPENLERLSLRDCVDGVHYGVARAVQLVFGKVQEQDGFWWWHYGVPFFQPTVM
jgi:predicted O-methyltransferase YrrM